MFAPLLLAFALPLAPEEPGVAQFALVIGVNTPAQPSQQPLRYADDDAARWFDLLRTLGARATVLARIDDDTRRLHAQAAGEASPPTRAALKAAVAGLKKDIEKAKANGLTTELYVVYAGHGHRDENGAWLALEDGKLDSGGLFDDIVGAIGAARAHVVVDACYSFFLAYDRGPGGKVRPLSGFMDIERVSARGEVGLLLSTSTTAKSHEWELFQSGVFSHEVRSGLLGAADIDRDGLVSYREIAAFVERANAPIANSKFRPRVYARAPATSDVLADLRSPLERRIDIDASKTGRFFIEDERGVRLADFHSSTPVQLVRPAASGRLFVVDVSRDAERVIDPGDGVVALASIEPQAPHARERGAAQEAFATIFNAPFTLDDVQAWKPPTLDDLAALIAAEPPTPTRSPLFVAGVALIGGGVLASGGFAAGAYALDQIIGDPRALSDEKEQARTMGLGMLVGLGVGVATVGVGATCAAIALGDQ